MGRQITTLDEETVDLLQGKEVIVYTGISIGQMIFSHDPAGPDNNFVIGIHPLDHIWIVHRNDALARLEASSEWIRRQIDTRFERLAGQIRWTGIAP